MDQTKAASDKSTPLRPLQEKRLLHRYETQLYTGGKTHFGRKHWRKKQQQKDILKCLRDSLVKSNIPIALREGIT